jgi:hypothetical protein
VYDLRRVLKLKIALNKHLLQLAATVTLDVNCCAFCRNSVVRQPLLTAEHPQTCHAHHILVVGPCTHLLHRTNALAAPSVSSGRIARTSNRSSCGSSFKNPKPSPLIPL